MLSQQKTHLSIFGLLLLLITATSCLGEGNSATGTLVAEVTVVQNSPQIINNHSNTITLAEAYLTIAEIEIIGGEGSVEHNHDDNEDHDHGGEHANETALEAIIPGQTINLLSPNAYTLAEQTTAAGNYSNVFVSLAPAENGISAGTTLHLTGSVTKDLQTRFFNIRWEESILDFAAFTDTIVVEKNHETHITLMIDPAAMIANIDFFASDLVTIVDHVTTVNINSAENASKLAGIQAGIASAIVLEVAEHPHTD